MISDERVAKLYGRRSARRLREQGTDCELFTFPAGEPSKSRAEWSRLTDALLDAGFGRDGGVIALGGGVTGDLAGFVAASYMRGIPVVQVPTSLVAMIDASVGGKVGVNTPRGKNLVGAFHPPRAVIVDADTVTTLPREQRSQGLVEAVKHGAILDRSYLHALESRLSDLLDGAPEAAVHAVMRSVEIKSDVVSRDEREAGLRAILNFGHTIGHALEASARYRLPHGSAVGLGMILEARIGERMGITEAGSADALESLVERLELPTRIPSDVDPGPALEHLRQDKKRRKGRPRYVLLSRLGEVAAGENWTFAVPSEVVRAVLEGE
jgi:3-dehydroquinate synthase